MEDHVKSKDELLGLLGNCVLALALLPEGCKREIQMARDASEQHIAELDARFPGWRFFFPGNEWCDSQHDDCQEEWG